MKNVILSGKRLDATWSHISRIKVTAKEPGYQLVNLTLGQIRLGEYLRAGAISHPKSANGEFGYTFAYWGSVANFFTLPGDFQTSQSI
jgi:hypothetical protein